MADVMSHPHNLMVRAMLNDVAEATSFLQRHLPQEVSQTLDWATLTLREGSFVDEDLRASEVDFLYEIALRSGEDAVWIAFSASHTPLSQRSNAAVSPLSPATTSWPAAMTGSRVRRGSAEGPAHAVGPAGGVSPDGGLD